MTGTRRIPAADLKRPKKTRKREQFEGWVPPRLVCHPKTGEWVRPFGPPQLILKPNSGRPQVRLRDVILRFVEAEVAKRSADPDTKKPTRLAAITIAEREALGLAEKTLQSVARWVRDPTRGPLPTKNPNKAKKTKK